MLKPQITIEGAFARLGVPSDIGGEQLKTPQGEVENTNAHIHIPPNFSAFAGAEEAVRLAHEQCVAVLGCSNYYDFSVYREFLIRCVERRVFPLFGVEVIVFDENLERAGVRVNDPKNPGKMYLCGKGLTKCLELPPMAEAILQEIKSKDAARAREMIRRLNEHFHNHSLAIEVDYDDVAAAVAERYGVTQDTVCLQERHLAEAYEKQVSSLVPPEAKERLLTELFQAAPSSLHDPMKLQEDIRTHLVKAGKPGYVEEEFIAFEEATQLILELGGIPCYPVLIDGATPVCEFESSPEALWEQLQRLNVHLAEFIPIRNALPNLARYVKFLRDRGMPCTCGTEHNTPNLIPMIPSCAGGVPLDDEMRRVFWEGACLVAAHQYLRINGEEGYVDSHGGPPYGGRQGREARIREMASFGEAVIRRFRQP